MRTTWQKYQANLSAAQRELRRAVERAGDTDLHRGHYCEAARRARAIRDEADAILRALDPAK